MFQKLTDDITVIPETIPDQGLLARVKNGSISGLSYEYKASERKMISLA